ILEKDMFPLSQLLNVIEMAIPKTIVINELTLTKGASSLILKGESPDAASVADFLNALKRSKRFTIDFNRGSVTGGKGFSFEIIAHWKRNDI
ncbi:MAG: PilN domain-containing protein, partial [Desulfobacterium sp.]